MLNDRIIISVQGKSGQIESAGAIPIAVDQAEL